MTKDDSKLQIPLFEAIETSNVEKENHAQRKNARSTTKGTNAVKKSPAKQKTASLEKHGERKEPVKTERHRTLNRESVSGQVPDGDVRLTANIREDLHLRLKIAAARRRTTIGELIEQLVDQHLPD